MKKNLTNGLALTLALLSATGSWCASVALSVNPTSLFNGEQITYTVTIQGSIGDEVDINVLPFSYIAESGSFIGHADGGLSVDASEAGATITGTLTQASVVATISYTKACNSHVSGQTIALALGQIGTAFVRATPVHISLPRIIVTGSHSVSVGGDIALTATSITGAGYQWELSTDGGATFNPISGANSSIFAKAQAQVSDSGLYKVVIKINSCTITSTPFSVTVHP